MEKAIIIKFHIALKKNDRKVKSKIWQKSSKCDGYWCVSSTF